MSVNLNKCIEKNTLLLLYNIFKIGLPDKVRFNKGISDVINVIFHLKNSVLIGLYLVELNLLLYRETGKAKWRKIYVFLYHNQ